MKKRETPAVSSSSFFRQVDVVIDMGRNLVRLSRQEDMGDVEGDLGEVDWGGAAERVWGPGDVGDGMDPKVTRHAAGFMHARETAGGPRGTNGTSIAHNATCQVAFKWKAPSRKNIQAPTLIITRKNHSFTQRVAIYGGEGFVFSIEPTNTSLIGKSIYYLVSLDDGNLGNTTRAPSLTCRGHLPIFFLHTKRENDLTLNSRILNTCRKSI